MVSLFLLSIVLCVLFVPLLVARAPHPRRALKRALYVCAAFNAVYGVGLYFAGGMIAEKL